MCVMPTSATTHQVSTTITTSPRPIMPAKKRMMVAATMRAMVPDDRQPAAALGERLAA